MATPGSVVVWEWLFHSAHWLPYEPAVSNYVETVHAQWLARGGASAWPNQSNVAYLKNVSLSLALFVIDLNTMRQTNQSTGTYLLCSHLFTCQWATTLNMLLDITRTNELAKGIRRI